MCGAEISGAITELLSTCPVFANGLCKVSHLCPSNTICPANSLYTAYAVQPLPCKHPLPRKQPLPRIRHLYPRNTLPCRHPLPCKQPLHCIRHTASAQRTTPALQTAFATPFPYQLRPCHIRPYTMRKNLPKTLDQLIF